MNKIPWDLCKLSYREVPDNLLEALILSNSDLCYDIVKEWYNTLGYNQSFESHLRNVYCDKKRVMLQLRKFCNKRDSYKMIHQLRKIDFSEADHSDEGVTLLHTACYRAYDDVVQWIFDENIIGDDNLNAKDNRGGTALHSTMAGILNLGVIRIDQCSQREKRIVTILVHQQKINISLTNNQGKTAKQFVLDKLGQDSTLYDDLIAIGAINA